MTPLTEQKERPAAPSKVHMGYSLFIAPHLTENKQSHDHLWPLIIQDALQHAPKDFPCHFELQYEQPYNSGYWQTLVEPIRAYVGEKTTIGLHSPSLNPAIHDLGNQDAGVRERAVQETVDALQFAVAAGCNEYVLHLTPFDEFGGYEARERQRANAMESLRAISHKVGGDPGVRILIENLEYPKWPSTTEETVQLMQQINDEKLFADVGICLDFAHLWHNIVSLLPNIPNRGKFFNDAQQFVKEVSSVSPIYRIHLAGAYINYVGDNHQTHAVPGANPLNEGDTHFYYHTPPEEFQGLWMSIDDALRATTGIRNPQNDISFVIEAHSPHALVLQESTRAIRDRLLVISEEK